MDGDVEAELDLRVLVLQPEEAGRDLRVAEVVLMRDGDEDDQLAELVVVAEVEARESWVFVVRFLDGARRYRAPGDWRVNGARRPFTLETLSSYLWRFRAGFECR